MSETLEVTERPRRGRPPRQEAQATARRRRQAGSLNRMVDMTLDFLPPEALDHANWVYRWANDLPGRLRRLTVHDDYDFVRADEIEGGFHAFDDTDSESEGRVSVIVGTNQGGKPLRAFLIKKPRAFWEADQEEMVQTRQAMMEGRVYHGALDMDGTVDSDAPSDRGDTSEFYAPKGNVIGHAGERRRGPIPQRKK